MGVRMKILVVEDEPELLEFFCYALRSLGHDVVSGTNGLEGMKCLTLNKIDVILSDIDMPGMSGLAFHQKVRALPDYDRIPWIFLTAYKSLTKYDPAMSPKFDMILEKPFPLRKLLKLFSGQCKSQ